MLMKFQTVLAALSSLAIPWFVCGLAPAAVGQEKPVLITVWLPADAELEMVGQKMPGVGSVRRFQSPPIEVDKEFTYVFKAAWKDDGKARTMEKKVKVRGGQTIEVDLNPENELTAEEKGVLEIVNNERRKVGAAPLKANPKLCRAARGHSANMAAKNTLAHTLDGKTFSQRIEDTGYRCGEAGETVPRGLPLRPTRCRCG
jgi:uncharacterized protein (TIGR03000 family)